MSAATEHDYWMDIAARWAHIGSPLRPSEEDVSFFCGALRQVERPGLRALILGVTQELYRLPWPEGAEVRALDHTKAMIGALWHGTPEHAHCGEWTNIPPDLRQMDLVMCDGGFHLLSNPKGQSKLAKEIARALSEEGRFCLRLFSLPETLEDPSVVLSDLANGRIPSMNHLKMRLAMSLQESAEDGVQLSHIWKTLNEAEPDLCALADRLGWSHEHAQAVETYKTSPNRYHFLTTDQAIRLVCDEGGLTTERIDWPSYILGERCPTVTFRKRGGK